MYTIIMDSNKKLVATEKIKLYQGEDISSKIQFLFPQIYGDIDIQSCTAILKCILPGNVPYVCLLTMDEEFYRNKIRFLLPVDSELMNCAGNIVMRITLLKTDSEEIALHTGEVVIKLHPLDDISSSVDCSSIESVDNEMLELLSLSGTINTVDSEKADNISVANNKLSLLSNGEKIGDAVDIVTPRINDGEYDGDSDGIVDLENFSS